jgi:hypothetical protein
MNEAMEGLFYGLGQFSSATWMGIYIAMNEVTVSWYKEELQKGLGSFRE